MHPKTLKYDCDKNVKIKYVNICCKNSQGYPSSCEHDFTVKIQNYNHIYQEIYLLPPEKNLISVIKVS